MNRILSSGTLLMTVMLLANVGAAAAQTSGGLAYIDSQRILAEAPGTSEAQRAFEQDMERYRSELERMTAQLDSLQDNFNRQQATLSATVREQRQQEIQQKFMEYQQRSMELEETAQQRQAELVGPIMRRISEVIEQIRTEGNYAMIFDTATGALITADPQLDLTDRVLERLRQTASR